MKKQIRMAKVALRAILPASVFRILKHFHRAYAIRTGGPFSDEEQTILKWQREFKISGGFFVDIAAQDGIGGSQTLQLAKRGWSGLAVECDGYYFSALSHFYANFPKIDLVRAKITPANVSVLLHACSCPEDFEFLSLDIDSFDYEILDSILTKFRPKLICCEINEVIPPPVAFRVKYSSNHQWQGGSFQGQSIAMCARLIAKYRYKIVELFYNNLFLIPVEANEQQGLTVIEAYQKGYLNKSDRLERFPWNKKYEQVHGLCERDTMEYFSQEFKGHEGKFELAID